MAITLEAAMDTPLATHSPHRPSRCRRIAMWCCWWVIFLSLFNLGFITLIRWLILHPQQGTYAHTDANLILFKLTHDDNNTSYFLNADVDLTLLFGNPNKKMGLFVEDVTVQALIFNGEEEIGGVVAVPSFHQKRRIETTFVLRASAVKRILSETVGAEMQAEIQRNDITVLVVVRGQVHSDDHWYLAMDHGRRIRLTCVVNLTAPQVGTNQSTVVKKTCEW